MANNNSGKNEKGFGLQLCGKHQDEVERMIIGPVNICSECIGLCHDLLRQAGSAQKRPSGSRQRKPRPCPARCRRSGYQHHDPGRDQGKV